MPLEYRMKKRDLPEIDPQVDIFFRTNEPDPNHARQVAYLADQLFLGLQEIHRMGNTERNRIRYASLLHDIGITSSDQPHHKRSMSMILQDRSMPFSDEERLIIALLTRYHRKAVPSEKHPEFAVLSKVNKKSVLFSAGIIRVADALDRSHRSLIQKLTCDLSPGLIRITCSSKSPLDLEQEALITKGSLLSELTGREVILIW